MTAPYPRAASALTRRRCLTLRALLAMSVLILKLAKLNRFKELNYGGSRDIVFLFLISKSLSQLFAHGGRSPRTIS